MLMKKSGIFVLGILIILVLAVSVSGCTDNSGSKSYNLNNTFSKEGLTFNYPSDFKEINTSVIVSGTSDNIDLGTYASPDNNTKISATKISLVKSPTDTIRSLADYSMINWKGSSDFQKLSDVSKNVTGASEAYEIIYTNTDPETNKFIKGYALFLGNQGKAEYLIQVKGTNDTFENTKKLYNQMFPTIKITS